MVSVPPRLHPCAALTPNPCPPIVSIGVSLYFYSSHSKSLTGDVVAFNKFDCVKSADAVMDLFASKQNRPYGGTLLAKALNDALTSNSVPVSQARYIHFRNVTMKILLVNS